MNGREKDFAHGLVVGKFYPPHRGHVHLVQTALERCRCVTVQVLHATVESIPGPDRARWLAQCFGARHDLRVVHGLDDEPVDYDSPAAWEAHEKIMRDVLEHADLSDPRPSVDAVFTSEAYGQELARRFRAVHVPVDPARSAHQVSGTAVRADAPGRWMDLPASVRAGLCRRVVVVGAESTGTTTLSVDLHRALVARDGVWARTRWVAEYGREYSEDLQERQRVQNLSHLPSDFPWNEADFREICRVQLNREEASAREGSPVLVCDTDGLATCLWQERYMGDTSGWVRAFAAALPPRALYLLTSHEGVDFEDDGLRDQPQLRPGMTRRFREILSEGVVPWFELRGSPAERLEQALAIVDADLARAFRFADPLG